jgi:hypothetical protein
MSTGLTATFLGLAASAAASAGCSDMGLPQATEIQDGDSFICVMYNGTSMGAADLGECIFTAAAGWPGMTQPPACPWPTQTAVR